MSCNSHPSLYITFDPLKKKTVFPKYANIYLIKYFKIQFKILVKIILTLKKTCKSETFRQIQVYIIILYSKTESKRQKKQ